MNTANPNAGLELLPSGGAKRKAGNPMVLASRIVANGMSAAGLGGAQHRVREVKPVVREEVSIFGAAKGLIWVRVESLAQGTTAEDVMVREVSVSVCFAHKRFPHGPPCRTYNGSV